VAANVKPIAVIVHCPGEATDLFVCFYDNGPSTELGQLIRGGQPCRARTNNDYRAVHTGLRLGPPLSLFPHWVILSTLLPTKQYSGRS